LNSKKIILLKYYYSANQVIGAANVYPNYGDYVLAWSINYSSKAMDYIVLKYNQAVYVAQINIYETSSAGSIIKIEVKNNQTNEWSIVWQSSSPQLIKSSRIFSPTLTATSFKTQEVRLTLDCSLGDWCDIDAVGKLV
jgi:hypothetical protein